MNPHEALSTILTKMEGEDSWDALYKKENFKGLSKVDVVICTKNRHHMLPNAIAEVKERVPCNDIIIVDSSSQPNVPRLKKLDANTFLVTPDVLLGFARQIGLLCAKTPVVMFMDDDITLEYGWYRKMVTALTSNSKALAASSKVIFGYKTDKVLEKIHSCSLRGEGASVGVALFKRDAVLALGGFNPKTHRGEDAELELKMKSKGYKWLRVCHAKAYHPLTFSEYKQKATDNVEGWLLIWQYSKHHLRFLLERTGAFLIMPFYYMMLTRSLKVLYYYAMFKGTTLFSFLRRVKNE